MRRLVAALVLLAAGAAAAQTIALNPLWTKPAAPFRVIGNIYHVGSEGLASWLIVTPEGDILIDGGMAENAPIVEANIRALGFKLSDVKILLNSHAHLDHAGALAKIKADTNARVIASEGDKPLLESGVYPGREKDASLGFPPVKVDQVIKGGQTVSLGGVTLTANITPGHTPGCTTWTMPVTDAGKSHNVVFFCSVTVAANKLAGPQTTYPGIVADYRRTFAEAPTIKADVFLAPHPESYGFVEKRAKLLANRKQGSDENPFVAPGALQATLAGLQRDFEKQLAAQTKALEQKP